jgi:hypothetical protein
MKKTGLLLVFIIAAAPVCFGLSSIPGSFISIGTARASAMGGAFTAVADDASAIFYNPAGLVNTKYKEASFMYCQEKGIIPYNYGMLGVPINDYFAAGLGVMVDGDSLYNETTIAMSGSTKLDWLQKVVPGVCVGANLKMLFSGYGSNTGGDTDTTDKVTGHATGLGLDLGLLWAVTPEVQLGAMLSNLTSGLWWTTDSATTFESVGLASDLGIKYGMKEFTLAAAVSDLDKVKIGFEKNLFKVIDIRGGFSQTMDIESYKEYMVGFGVGHFEFGQRKEFSMNFDCAYEFERLANTLKIQTSFKYK